MRKVKSRRLSLSQDLIARFIKVETLLEEHLKAHNKINCLVFYPILAGIILIVVRVYFFGGLN